MNAKTISLYDFCKTTKYRLYPPVVTNVQKWPKLRYFLVETRPGSLNLLCNLFALQKKIFSAIVFQKYYFESGFGPVSGPYRARYRSKATQSMAIWVKQTPGRFLKIIHGQSLHFYLRIENLLSGHFLLIVQPQFYNF